MGNKSSNKNGDKDKIIPTTEKLSEPPKDSIMSSTVSATVKEFKGCWPDLSLKERIIGWFVCCFIGWVLSFMASVSLVASDDIAGFAIMYSLGQILNILGSMILASPKAQWKAMTSKTRRFTSLIYVLSIVATVVVAVVVPVKAFTFICLGIQMCAYFWYSLSYVPCGQKAFKKLVKAAC